MSTLFPIIVGIVTISQYMSGTLTPSKSMVEWMKNLNVINPARRIQSFIPKS